MTTTTTTDTTATGTTATDTDTATRPGGLTPGTWNIDASHSDVSFSVRHLMVSKVRGHFTKFAGEISIGGNLLDSHVTAKIDMASIDTRDEGRDTHLRSNDFFSVDTHPEMTYTSTGIREADGDYIVDGALTLHGITRPVELELEFNGVARDPWGGTRAGFTASGVINRKDFGIDISMPLDGGGVVVGDKVNITLEVEAVLAEVGTHVAAE